MQAGNFWLLALSKKLGKKGSIHSKRNSVKCKAISGDKMKRNKVNTILRQYYFKSFEVKMGTNKTILKTLFESLCVNDYKKRPYWTPIEQFLNILTRLVVVK